LRKDYKHYYEKNINLGVIGMGNEQIVKVVGIALSVIGMGLNLASGILEDKKMDIKIAKEVSKHLRKR
jgi:hypothetical protein